MTPPLRVATVGNGYFSQFHHRAWRRVPEVQLIATCDLDLERARKTAVTYRIPSAYGDLERMLDETEPALLDIIAPPAAHLPAIEAAACRGIDVICQKPFCGDLATAESAVALAEAAGIQLFVHENFRFQPWYGEIARLLASGVLGAVYGATFRLRPGDGGGPDAYLARQPYFREMRRFMVHETGVHIVDVFRYLFGEVRSVSARLRRLNPVIAGEDAGIVMLEMDSGVLAILDANRLADHPAENRRLTLGEMLIEGENGSVSLSGNGEISLRYLGQNKSIEVDFDWRNEDFGGDCVYRTQQAIVDGILGRIPPVSLARPYLNNLRIEDAIYESDHQQGRAIDIVSV